MEFMLYLIRTHVKIIVLLDLVSPFQLNIQKHSHLLTFFNFLYLVFLDCFSVNFTSCAGI